MFQFDVLGLIPGRLKQQVLDTLSSWLSGSTVWARRACSRNFDKHNNELGKERI